MTVMMDIVFASVILGMIILTVMNVNINLTQENWKGMVELNTQTEAIQLARIMEFDLYKIGYRVPFAARPSFMVADSEHVKFKTNLGDLAGAVDIVEYGLGDLVLNSKNPRDRMLFRIENITKVYINYSVVGFKMSYYDSNDVKLSTPVSGAANLNKIRSVRVLLKLESPEPFDTTFAGGVQYASAMYSKLIYPRNLNFN
jgi:hypothetical protein